LALLTETIFPELQVIPLLLRKYGGSAKIKSTEPAENLGNSLKESPSKSVANSSLWYGFIVFGSIDNCTFVNPPKSWSWNTTP
jgi:hypothetical protein